MCNTAEKSGPFAERWLSQFCLLQQGITRCSTDSTSRDTSILDRGWPGDDRGDLDYRRLSNIDTQWVFLTTVRLMVYQCWEFWSNPHLLFFIQSAERAPSWFRELQIAGVAKEM